MTGWTERARHWPGTTLVHAEGDDSFEIVEKTGDLVEDHMAPAVQAIRADEPLFNAVKMMCGQHIHRVPVLDGRGHLVGILSSLDVVAAVSNAIEESQ